MKKATPKIAIVYDALCCKSGGERVLLDIFASFPSATVYTLMYNAQAVYPEIHKLPIKTSWFNYIARNEKWYKRLFFPLGIIAMRMLDLRDYSVVIMVSTHCSKYVRTSESALTICYCFTPFRLAWNPDSYRIYSESKGLKRYCLNFVISILRAIDLNRSQNIKTFIAMTQECALRIRACYNRLEPISIIPPAVDLEKYKNPAPPQDYYLVVSRLESYKKVDLAINACKALGRKLIIVGRGSQLSYFKSLADDNINFKSGLSDDEVATLYRNCKALIFPQHEDYGLTALEANASGRPVIAFDAGGIRETMMLESKGGLEPTAILFKEQTVESLVDAIKLFEIKEFDPTMMRKNAERFSRERFQEKIVAQVQ